MVDQGAEEGDVPHEVGLHGPRVDGVRDDVVGFQPLGELPRHQQVGQLRRAVDSLGVIVPARRVCTIYYAGCKSIDPCSIEYFDL